MESNKQSRLKAMLDRVSIVKSREEHRCVQDSGLVERKTPHLSAQREAQAIIRKSCSVYQLNISGTRRPYQNQAGEDTDIGLSVES